MTILAVEFSTERRSVAVLAGDAAPVSHAEQYVRTVTALQLVERVLAAGQVGREQIECIAVSLGPGSYTGIRSAITLAQGWQFAKSTRVLALSAPECIAAQLAEEGYAGEVDVVMNAQRKEFYVASYAMAHGNTRALAPVRLVPQAEVELKIAGGGVVVGPELGGFFPAAREIFPEAATLARLAARRSDFVGAETLEPIYLRPPDFVKAPRPS